MAFRNTLYPYKFTVKRGEQSEEVTGHAANADEARRHIETSIAGQVAEPEGELAVITAFEFDGKPLDFQQSK